MPALILLLVCVALIWGLHAAAKVGLIALAVLVGIPLVIALLAGIVALVAFIFTR